MTRSAADAAFRLLAEAATFVVIDTETCPADDGSHVIAIAAAFIKNGRRHGTWSTLVNPGVPITNSGIHHLTDADVTGEPTFGDAQVAGKLGAILADLDVVVVAHNAAFDLGVLHLEHVRLGTGQTLPDRPVLDTMTLPEVVGHSLRRPKLSVLLTSLGLTNANPHDAASDADATANAFLALLRVAATNGYGDLAALLAEAGTTIAAIPATKAERSRSSDVRDLDLPAAHVARHLHLLPGQPTAADLDKWADLAVECAGLRCPLLADRAELDLAHATELHPRLSAALARFAATARPGQGATLVGALKILTPAAFTDTRQVRPWWKRHRPTITALPRCGDGGTCPYCADGEPCPLDVAHQPLARFACGALDGPVPKGRRREVSGDGQHCLVADWARLGLPDLAGYAAALVADAWAAEGHHSRTDTVIDQAIQTGAHDPRIILAHAHRLADHQRHDDATSLATEHLGRRTTDPAWDHLAAWLIRHQGRSAVRKPPAAGPAKAPTVARPGGRTRPKRFCV
jgi:DNA polymerase III epsilon subunit-like protein